MADSGELTAMSPGMDATMSADHSLIPFLPCGPTEEDLRHNLGHEPSSSALGARRYPWQPGFMVFVWLLVSGLLAITAIYHVVLDGPGSRLLAWSASGGAVILLSGALILGQRAWFFASPGLGVQASALLLLSVFTVPTVQLLLTLVVSQDLTYTTFVLLLLIGYALLAPTTESLLLYTTITLAGWSACALRRWSTRCLAWLCTALGCKRRPVALHS